MQRGHRKTTHATWPPAALRARLQAARKAAGSHSPHPQQQPAKPHAQERRGCAAKGAATTPRTHHPSILGCCQSCHLGAAHTRASTHTHTGPCIHIAVYNVDRSPAGQGGGESDTPCKRPPPGSKAPPHKRWLGRCAGGHLGAQGGATTAVNTHSSVHEPGHVTRGRAGEPSRCRAHKTIQDPSQTPTRGVHRCLMTAETHVEGHEAHTNTQGNLLRRAGVVLQAHDRGATTSCCSSHTGIQWQPAHSTRQLLCLVNSQAPKRHPPTARGGISSHAAPSPQHGAWDNPHRSARRDRNREGGIPPQVHT